jgi:hypothetical protein
MAFAILLGGIVGLLVAGAVVAIGMVTQARRDKDDLDVAFAEAAGHDPDSGEMAPATWSSFDMAVLRDEVTDVDGNDPFATLIQASTRVEWHDETLLPNGADPEAVLDQEPVLHHESVVHEESVLHHEPVFDEEPVPEPEPVIDPSPVPHPAPVPSPVIERAIADGNRAIAEGHPVLTQALVDGKPVLWQAPGQPPVIILVVGVGFIGAGGGAVAAASRLRQEDVRSSFTPHHDDMRDGNGGSTPQPAFDVEAVNDDITVGEPDQSPTPNRVESTVGWEDGATNGSEVDRIAWRAPGQLTRR